MTRTDDPELIDAADHLADVAYALAKTVDRVNGDRNAILFAGIVVEAIRNYRIAAGQDTE